MDFPSGSGLVETMDVLLLTQSRPCSSVNDSEHPPGGQMNRLDCSAPVTPAFVSLVPHNVSCLSLMAHNTSYMKGDFFLTGAGALSSTVHLSWVH